MKKLNLITVKVKKEAKKVGTVERVMRQSTAIPEPSFWLVRSGDAKIDCRIAGARCSENGGSSDKKKTPRFLFARNRRWSSLGWAAGVCAGRSVFHSCVLRKGTDKMN